MTAAKCANREPANQTLNAIMLSLALLSVVAQRCGLRLVQAGLHLALSGQIFFVAAMSASDARRAANIRAIPIRSERGNASDFCSDERGRPHIGVSARSAFGT